MTDLVVNVDLAHPVARVWRALTDRGMLSAWFLPTAADAVVGRRARVHPPAGLAGMGDDFDVEITEVVESQLIRQRWTAKEWQAEIIWELTETDDGCRLRVTHTGFHGIRGERRRRALRRTYQTMFGERLPESLLRTTHDAVGPDAVGVDAAGPDAVGPDAVGVDAGPDGTVPDDATVELHTGMSSVCQPAPSVATVAEPRPRVFAIPLPTGRRARISYPVAALLLVMLCGTGAAVVLGAGEDDPLPPAGQAHPVDDQPTLTAPPYRVSSAATSKPKQSGRSAVIKATQSATASPSSTPEASPSPPAPLEATYRTVSRSFSGYDTEVTVRNPGSGPHDGWSVVITMSSDNSVQNRSPGVVAMTQNGAVITLTPVGSAQTVPPGGSVTFAIRSPTLIARSAQVENCTIDEAACAKP